MNTKVHLKMIKVNIICLKSISNIILYSLILCYFSKFVNTPLDPKKSDARSGNRNTMIGMYGFYLSQRHHNEATISKCCANAFCLLRDFCSCLFSSGFLRIFGLYNASFIVGMMGIDSGTCTYLILRD